MPKFAHFIDDDVCMEPMPAAWPTSPDTVRQEVRQVVDSVIHPNELDECNVIWLALEDAPRADYVNTASLFLHGDTSPTLWVQVIAGGEEWWHGTWRAEMNWDGCLASLADQLESWVSETAFAWGQQRVASLPRRPSE